MIKLLLFLFFLQIHMAKQCLPHSNHQFLCLDHFSSGKLKSLEIISQGQLVPNISLYLYENSRPMVYMNWKEKQFIHFKKNGQLHQRLDQDDYSHYQNNEAITHCIGAKCSSQKWEFFKINTDNLQIGDVIFSGNLSIYAGTGRAQFTHISIFAGYKNGVAQVLGSEMAEKIQISDFDDSIYNTINYVVLRSEKFKIQVQKLLKNQAYKYQHFCSELFRNLVAQSFKKAHNPINSFASIHPETLLQNNYSYFQIIDLKLQNKQNSLELFFKSRKTELEKQVNEWHQIVSDPQSAIYQIFAKQFIFLPLVFSRTMMESMIRFSTSGIFTNPLSIKEEIETSNDQNPYLKASSSTCFPSKNKKKLCFYTDEKLQLLSFEVFSRFVSPDWLVYLKDQKLSNYLKFQKDHNIYFQFDQSSKLSSRYVKGNFLKFDQGQVTLRCKQEQCISPKRQWTQLPKDQLQVGDVIFTGATFSYSSNQKSFQFTLRS